MTPLEKVTLASGCTLSLGAWLGYKFRRMIERAKLRREAKRLHNAQVDRDNAKLMADVKAYHRERRGQLDKRVLKPEVLPAYMVPVTRPPHVTEQPIPVVKSDDYDDVVSALVGAGFKKRLAERAVDACDEDERGSPETWTAAALRRAATMP